MSIIEIPANALVMLVGASGSGKSSWARRHFLRTQVVSSDECRALVSDDEENQQVNREAFAVFYTLLSKRLRLGRLTVADSTALEQHSRARMRRIAGAAGRPVCAVTFLVAHEELLGRMALRPRKTPEDVLLRHVARLAELARNGVLENEGYHAVHYLHGHETYETTPVVSALVTRACPTVPTRGDPAAVPGGPPTNGA